jgi:hypothetical protein
MTTPAGLDLLAVNVRFFFGSLSRLTERQSRPLYVSPHTRTMASSGPAEYWVGCYTRNTSLPQIVEDLELHLGMQPGALRDPMRQAARIPLASNKARRA